MGPTLALVLIPMAGCNVVLVVILLILSMSTIGFETGGAAPIVSEMAPAISGTVFGVTNTFSCSIGFIAPLLSGIILGDNVTNYFVIKLDLIIIIFNSQQAEHHGI